MKKLIATVVAVGVLMADAGMVTAQQKTESKGDALLEILVKKGVITKEEAAQVKAEWDKQLAAAIEKQDKIKVASWISEMKWSGDLRLRSNQSRMLNPTNQNTYEELTSQS